VILDAPIAAVCRQHGLDRLLGHDRDFHRFAHLLEVMSLDSGWVCERLRLTHTKEPSQKWGVRRACFKVTELTRELGIGHSAVSHAVRRGEHLAGGQVELNAFSTLVDD
jgi:hypothetical protein